MAVSQKVAIFEFFSESFCQRQIIVKVLELAYLLTIRLKRFNLAQKWT